MQQLPQRNLGAETGQPGQAPADRIVEPELARLREHQNSDPGDLLAAAGEMKDRIRHDCDVPGNIREAVTGRMHNGSRLDDRQ